MKIETAFSLGQSVYTLEDGRPIFSEITKIRVSLSLYPYTEPPQREEYKLFDAEEWRQKKDIFASPEELFDHLRDKTESLI